MFKESKHTTDAIVDLIHTLPQRQQKVIVKKLAASKSPKKLSKKAKKKQEVLKSIEDGLREIKEAKRSGKKRKTMEEFLNEL